MVSPAQLYTRLAKLLDVEERKRLAGDGSSNTSPEVFFNRVGTMYQFDDYKYGQEVQNATQKPDETHDQHVCRMKRLFYGNFHSKRLTADTYMEDLIRTHRLPHPPASTLLNHRIRARMARSGVPSPGTMDDVVAAATELDIEEQQADYVPGARRTPATVASSELPSSQQLQADLRSITFAVNALSQRMDLNDANAERSRYQSNSGGGDAAQRQDPPGQSAGRGGDRDGGRSGGRGRGRGRGRGGRQVTFDLGEARQPDGPPLNASSARVHFGTATLGASIGAAQPFSVSRLFPGHPAPTHPLSVGNVQTRSGGAAPQAAPHTAPPANPGGSAPEATPQRALADTGGEPPVAPAAPADGSGAGPSTSAPPQEGARPRIPSRARSDSPGRGRAATDSAPPRSESQGA